MASIIIQFVHGADGTSAYQHDMTDQTLDRIIGFLRNAAYPAVDPATGVVSPSTKNAARRSSVRGYVQGLKDQAKRWEQETAAATAAGGVADLPTTEI